MDSILALLDRANALSPLAIIGLLVVAVILLVRQNKKVDIIQGNDLHALLANLVQIGQTLQRIEVTLGRDLGYLKAKLDGNN